MSNEAKTVLVGQHITEKGSHIQIARQYVFKVKPEATKKQIKQSVETDFKVKVSHVNVVNMLGKTRRFGRSTGKRSDWKKAYVTLIEGHSISLPEPEAAKD